MWQMEKTAYWMPQSIGNYEIVGRLGRGGMGDIYKAVQKSLNRIVALKVLSPQMGRSEEFSRRFEIEAKAISLLQHNNIVSIYEYGEEQGFKYFAMQYVDGCDLGTVIATKKLLTIEEIIDYSKQICRGMRYAHSKEIIHRDIKPQNILIDKNNTCRITDFGIAKIFDTSSITMTGVAVGTPEYMSPEQAEGIPLDVQTDIYSLGIVIYEMLTKQPPFTGNNPVAIAYKQVHEMPVPPSALRKETPSRLELIVLKALKKNKNDRYKSVEAMLKHLDTVEIGDEAGAVTKTTTTKKRRDNPKSGFVDRRIVDRRTTSQSNSGNTDQIPLWSKRFWIVQCKTQLLSLSLFSLLTMLFFLHLIGLL
ncbi:MAG: serine/threonine protein kinase [Chitinivibrionales bacterium]|nr:serine/threonine protein kinase [Chitinivibrionales bacterium]